MQFFEHIKNSIYSPEFYRNLPKSTLGKAFAFYFLFAFLLSFLQAAIMLPQLFGVQTEIDKVSKQLINTYPKDLEVRIKDGKVSTTVKEPYTVPLPPSASSADQPQNLIVIDTKTPYSSTQFREYDTITWLTKDSLFYKEGSDDTSIRSVDLKNVEEFTLNKTLLLTIKEKAQPFMIYVGPFLGVLLFIGLLFLSIFRLLYLALLALLLIILAKLSKRELKYAQAYTIALYVVTLPLILTTLLSLTQPYLHLNPLPFLFTILSLIVFYCNFIYPKKIK